MKDRHDAALPWHLRNADRRNRPRRLFARRKLADPRELPKRKRTRGGSRDLAARNYRAVIARLSGGTGATKCGSIERSANSSDAREMSLRENHRWPSRSFIVCNDRARRTRGKSAVAPVVLIIIAARKNETGRKWTGDGHVATSRRRRYLLYQGHAEDSILIQKIYEI